MQEFGQNVDNRLRDSARNVDNKLSDVSSFLGDTKHVIEQDIDEVNKRAHVGLDETSDIASNIFGKGLLSHK